MNKKYTLAIACTILFTLTIFSFTNPGHFSRSYSGMYRDTANPFAQVKDYKGKSVVSTSGVITFTTGLDNDYYQVDSVGKEVYFYVEARLGKLVNLPQRRTPLNISIVIDRSGSMQGIKMGYAKKAAKALVDLMEPVDYVSIVMYDNAIDSVQEPVLVLNKEAIKNKIDKITPRGATNLWGGTERGYEYVKKNFKPGFINRVLLISDGLANVGITDSLKIRQMVQKFKDEEGISLSTFGVGLDYNEYLMTDMAETGAGNYYFIDHPDNMISQFKKEMSGMLQVVAQAAELKIKLPPGVRIQKSYPLRYTQVNDVIIVKMRDLFSEEIRGNLFRFSIQNGTSQPLRFQSTLSYTDAMDGQMRSATNENVLSPIKNINTYLTHYNKPVVEQTVVYIANENLEKAMAQVDQGDYEGATRSLQQNKAFLKANSSAGMMADYWRMDSINTLYAAKVVMIRRMPQDSIKKLQKISKSANYQIRNKKQ